MPYLSQLHFKTAAVFLIAAVAVGLQMSISGEHNVTGAHAHGALLGWVGGALFGAYYALNPERAHGWLPWAQFWLSQGAAAVMFVALYAMLLGYPGLVPVVAGASLAYLLGAILFALVVFGRAPGTVAHGHRMPAA